jgi:hypothetical protein
VIVALFISNFRIRLVGLITDTTTLNVVGAKVAFMTREYTIIFLAPLIGSNGPNYEDCAIG